MKLFKFVLSLVAVFAFVTCVAQGQDAIFQTWVSGAGFDDGPCTRTEPCRTFAYALSVTAAGGEIDAIDGGDFGGIYTTKSVTIDGGGQLGSIVWHPEDAPKPPRKFGVAKGASEGDIAVLVEGVDTVVTLRNLRIDGLGIAPFGIILGDEGSPAALHIEHCIITGISGPGIYINGSTGNQVFVEDTISQDNEGPGLVVQNSGGYSYVQISDSHFSNNWNGVEAGDASRVTVRNSDVSGNYNVGFLSDAEHASSYLSVTDSAATHNGVGAQAGDTGKVTWVRLSNVILIGNSPGIKVLSGGVVASWGNNHSGDNGTPNTPLTPQ